MRVDPATFLPHLAVLRFDRIEVTPQLITLTVAAVRPEAYCPLCHQPSTTVHSYDTRTVADLPWSGIRVTFLVRADAPRRVSCRRLCAQDLL